MTVAMPDPVPLDMPPGDPAAVDDLADGVAEAARRLAVLADELSGPAASAPGWLGADATAAETQLVRVARITRAAGDALLSAGSRLSSHGALLRDTRRQITALREEQDEDHRRAWQRLGDVENPQLAVMTGATAWVGVVDEFEASEAGRRRRHALLLEELADDAARTARVLGEATRPVGGTGRAGDGERVVAHLAAELPGWGGPELTHRGRALAEALMGPLTPDERALLTGDAVALASSPPFATALLRELGSERFGLLLDVLGREPDGPDHPLAAVLAAALGAAVPSGRPRDDVAAVLGATYVRAGDPYSTTVTAVGMAAVLSAAARSASGRPRTDTVGRWARQLLAAERAAGVPVGTPSGSLPWRTDARDPLALAVGIVGSSGDSATAAALLGDDGAWEVLLDRFWDDGGTALGELVAEAGRDAGPAGERAVRLGLEAIGAGLVEGDPSDRTVDRDVVESVSPALGDAAAAHVGVVADALAGAATEGGDGAVDLLKGLGYVTVDRQAAAAVEQALLGWAGAQPHDLAGSSRVHPLPAVAVPAAYLAVQEYGQRLTYALDGFELQDQAQDRAAWWNWTAGLLLEGLSFVRFTPVSLVADVVNGYAPVLLGLDGTWEQDPDRGLQFSAEGAGAGAVAALPPELTSRAAAVQAQSEAAYRRAAVLLGDPDAPTSPEKDWVGPAVDIATGGMADATTDELVDRAKRGRPTGGFLAGR